MVNETPVTFCLILAGSRTSSRERLSLAERQQMIDWMTDTGQQRGLTEKEAKQNSWTEANFHSRDQKLLRNPDKSPIAPGRYSTCPESKR